MYEIIIIDAFQNNNKSLNCSDIRNKILLDELKELSISKDKHEFFKTIFEDNIWVFDIIKNLKLCPNLKKQADEIFIHFVDKNKD